LNFFKPSRKIQLCCSAIEDTAEVARIAESELGLSVTAEELTSALAAMQKSEDASPEIELSNEQLEAVTGGWFQNWIINTKKVDFKFTINSF
jgi:hypothetical protein